MKLRFILCAWAALTVGAIAQDKTGQLSGMSQEIAVKPASELGIKAPAGANVAVIDQSWVAENPEVSQIIDHHNGWLQLADLPPTWPLKVTGKYFVPSVTNVPPKSLRLTLRRSTSEGLKIFSEGSALLEKAGEWVSFEVELPDKAVEGGDVGKFILMLAAVPLAGPLYLDDLHVTDASGNELWKLPSFE